MRTFVFLEIVLNIEKHQEKRTFPTDEQTGKSVTGKKRKRAKEVLHCPAIVITKQE